MIELMYTMEIFEEMYPRIRNLSTTAILSLIGLVIDQYGADHNMDSTATCMLIDELAAVQKSVHYELGMAF